RRQTTCGTSTPAGRLRARCRAVTPEARRFYIGPAAPSGAWHFLETRTGSLPLREAAGGLGRRRRNPGVAWGQLHHPCPHNPGALTTPAAAGCVTQRPPGASTHSASGLSPPAPAPLWSRGTPRPNKRAAGGLS